MSELTYEEQVEQIRAAHDGWVPCELLLPEKCGWYRVTQIDDDGSARITNGSWEGSGWFHEDDNNIAWKPTFREKPYQPTKSE